MSDAVLADLAGDPALWQVEQGSGMITIPVLSVGRMNRAGVVGNRAAVSRSDRVLPNADQAAGLAVLGLAAGIWARDAGLMDERKRRSGRLFARKGWR